MAGKRAATRRRQVRTSRRKGGRRKADRDATILPRALALLLTLTAVLFLGYLWVCGRCESLAAEIRDLEVRKDDLHRRVVNEEFKWHRTRSRVEIEAALRRFGLQMGLPPPDRVIHLARPLRPGEIEQDPVLRRQYAAAPRAERHD